MNDFIILRSSDKNLGTIANVKYIYRIWPTTVDGDPALKVQYSNGDGDNRTLITFEDKKERDVYHAKLVKFLDAFDVDSIEDKNKLTGLV